MTSSLINGRESSTVPAVTANTPLGSVDLPGCGRAASSIVELYSPAGGQIHGSLDGTAYACDEHITAAVDAIRAAGFNGFPARNAVERMRCGGGYDYVAHRGVVAPESPAGEPAATPSIVEPGVTTPAPALERASRAEAFAVLQAGITANLPVPEFTSFHQFEAGGVFHLHFDDDATEAVDMWAAYLGLAPAALTGSVRQLGERHWRTYESSIFRHPWLLNGWSMEVSCPVTVSAPEQPEVSE